MLRESHVNLRMYFGFKIKTNLYRKSNKSLQKGSADPSSSIQVSKSRIISIVEIFEPWINAQQQEAHLNIFFGSSLLQNIKMRYASIKPA